MTQKVMAASLSGGLISFMRSGYFSTHGALSEGMIAKVTGRALPSFSGA